MSSMYAACVIIAIFHLALGVNASRGGWHGHQLPEHARGGLAEEILAQWLPRSEKGERREAILPLDHFHQKDTANFTNYYFLDDTFFNGSGPIFVQMGGEGPLNGCGASDLHRDHGALALCVEHRFYGASTPRKVDGSLDRSVDTLKYLTVEQNLADTAAIVEIVQSQQKSRRPVINFGGSYSGATSAWFREAYPHVTMAASSSSGVVEALLNFTGFDATVALALGPSCSRNMRALTDIFVRAHKVGGEAWNDAKRRMRAENLVETPLGDDDFWYAIADAAQMMDQYGHKKMLCDALETFFENGGEASDDRTVIANYSDLVASFWGESFMGGCFYDSECVRNESSEGMARSWRWQKCTQLAYLQPGYAGSLRYEGLTLERLLAQCAYVFPNIPLPPNTHAFNKVWGGAHPTGTRVFFADYSDDPWRYVSVQRQLSPSQPYCYLECDGCGHCGRRSTEKFNTLRR